MKYNQLERRIATLTSKTPVLKKTLKTSYSYANYFIFGKNNYIESNYKIRRISPINSDCFFGYYDRSCISPDGTKCIFHKITNNQCHVIVVELDSLDVIENYQTPCWNWQQGALASWTYDAKLIFNTSTNGFLNSRLINLENGSDKLLDLPIQATSKNLDLYISINTEQMSKNNIEYGYTNLCCKKCEIFHSDDLLYISDYTGNIMHKVSQKDLDDLIPHEALNTNVLRKVNHATFSPTSDSIIFMYRIIDTNEKRTYLIRMDINNGKMAIIFDNILFSHYCWVNNDKIIAWCLHEGTPKYCSIDMNGSIKKWGDNKLHEHGDGHPSSLNDGNRLITDCYPQKDRVSTIFMYDYNSQHLEKLVSVSSPVRYRNEYRCDLHPRLNRGGNKLYFDSVHEGFRGLYELSLGSVS